MIRASWQEVTLTVAILGLVGVWFWVGRMFG